jgi:DNA-directed RNA polymerase beta subunit
VIKYEGVDMLNYLESNIKDPDIEEVTNVFINLISTYKTTKYETDDIDGMIKDRLDTIGKILSNRFNTKIKLKNKPIKGAKIYPLINQQALELKKKIRAKLDKQVFKINLDKKMSTMLYTLNEVENDLKQGVKIDTKDFRFLSDNGYEFTIELDIPFLIDSDLTGRELTAIIFFVAFCKIKSNF